jgi:hypothetical protein
MRLDWIKLLYARDLRALNSLGLLLEIKACFPSQQALLLLVIIIDPEE